MILWPHTFWPARVWPLNFWPDNAARYEVYSRATRDGADGDTLIDVLTPEDSQVVVTGAPNSEAWIWMRAFSPMGVADTEPIDPRIVRVAFDAAGALILPVPNTPSNLHLRLRAGGVVEARWTYLPDNQAAPPALYRVYVATGVDPFDFNTPTATVNAGGRVMTQTLGVFAHGTTVRAVVRAVAAHGVGPTYAEELNTTEATAIADAQAPDAPAPGSVSVEVVTQ